MAKVFHREIIRKGNRAVAICGADTNITAVLYANVGDGAYTAALADAVALTSSDFTTVGSARRWASQKLAA